MCSACRCEPPWPDRPREDLQEPPAPGLIALFIAQAAVFLAYPLYRCALDRRGWLAPSMVAMLAAALMFYGLYNAITEKLFT